MSICPSGISCDRSTPPWPPSNRIISCPITSSLPLLQPTIATVYPLSLLPRHRNSQRYPEYRHTNIEFTSLFVSHLPTSPPIASRSYYSIFLVAFPSSTFIARAPNLSVHAVSWTLDSAGDTAMIISVLLFPPSESWSRYVSLLFR